jgi:hypothetical protein
MEKGTCYVVVARFLRVVLPLKLLRVKFAKSCWTGTLCWT